MNCKDIILKVVGDYIESINECDLDLATKVWLTDDSVSLIHPRGHEKGWVNILNKFYKETMGMMFSSRKLKFSNVPQVEFFGDTVAVVEFYWDFTAKIKDSNQEVSTSGRESQVLIKQRNGFWKIVQVHYSDPVKFS